MSAFPKQEKIVSSILYGIELAKNNYTQWTLQELFLSDISDNFLTIHICQEIAKLKNQTEIFIDLSISDILKSSLNKKDLYNEFMKKNKIKNSTFSITLDDKTKNKNSVSRVIISVNAILNNSMSSHLNELNTMCKMIQKSKINDSSLKYGIFAFYFDVSLKARIKCKNKIENILQNFDDLISSKNNLKSFSKVKDIVEIKNVGEYCFGIYLVQSDLTNKKKV
ncbi:MAG: hypothetical protein HRT42_06445 [Campylobacteraceae bacterium]|nr:hypothetical protein [Campylobacteraceae bacterium]